MVPCYRILGAFFTPFLKSEHRDAKLKITHIFNCEYSFDIKISDGRASFEA
jgi:hypothetical protein